MLYRLFNSLSTRAQGAWLLGGLLIWAFLYAWLGQRLWYFGVKLNAINFLLGLICILLGVALIVYGWKTGKALSSLFRSGLAESRWPALSQEEIQALSPSDFEEYVAQRLFARQGYKVINTPDVKDGGIDVLSEDKRGRQAVTQCKRYKATVGSPVVRDLYGTMIHEGAVHAFLVVSGNISEDAREWAMDKPIGLIDGAELARLSKAPPGTLVY